MERRGPGARATGARRDGREATTRESFVKSGGGHDAPPESHLPFCPCDRMTIIPMQIMDLVAAVGAVAALLAAVFGYVNGRDIRELKGSVDEISRILTEHISAPGLHR